MSIRPRWRDPNKARRYQERYARRNGYFWMPCPVCHRPFGGHEAHGSIQVTGDETASMSICPSCAGVRQQYAERRLRELGETAQIGSTQGGDSMVWHVIGETLDNAGGPR